MTIGPRLADGAVEQLLAALAAWLADVWLLGTVLLIVSCGLQLVLRRAALRLAVSWGACLGLVVLAFAAGLPVWPRVDALSLCSRLAAPKTPAVADSSGSAEWAAATEADLESHRAILRELSQEARALMTSGPAVTSSVFRRHPWALAWLAAALGGCAWNLLGGLRMIRLLRRVGTAPTWVEALMTELVGTRRAPRLGTSGQLVSAVALGTLRPRILLPESSVREGQETVLQAALAHEWAHIRHGDLWLLALERLLLPLFWLHPLFWQVRRCARFDQDLLADVAAAGKDPMEYAQALLAWTRESRGETASRRPLYATLSMWQYPRTLTRRMEMILNAEQRTQVSSSRRALGLAGLLSLLVISGLSVLTIRPLTSTAQEKKPAAPDEAIQPEAAEKQAVAGVEQAVEAFEAVQADAVLEQRNATFQVLEATKAAQAAADAAAQRRKAARMAIEQEKKRLQDLGRVDEARQLEERLRNEDKLRAEIAVLEEQIADLRAVIDVLKKSRLAQGPGPVPAQNDEPAVLKIFPLQFRRSVDVAQLLPLFLPNDSLARVVSDDSTNSVIVRANEGDLGKIADAIQHLDELAAKHEQVERDKQHEALAEQEKIRAEQEARAAELAARRAAEAEARAQEAEKKRRPSRDRQQLEIELLQLDIAEAEAELEHASVESKTAEEMAQGGTVGADVVAAKRKIVRVAEIALRRAKLKLRSAELDLQEE